jgi:cytochrome c6
MILRKIKFGDYRGLLAALLLAFGTFDAYAADIVNGGKLYTMHCVVCHGDDGVNVMPDAPNFSRSESLLRPDVFILAAIKEGKNAMPAFQGMLKDQEILDVISYLRTLENGGPIRP